MTVLGLLLFDRIYNKDPLVVKNCDQKRITCYVARSVLNAPSVYKLFLTNTSNMALNSTISGASIVVSGAVCRGDIIVYVKAGRRVRADVWRDGMDGAIRIFRGLRG